MATWFSIICLCFALCWLHIEAMVIHVPVIAKKSKCFVEDLIENSLMVVEVEIKTQVNVTLLIHDGARNVHLESNKQYFKSSFMTNSSKYYICLHNDDSDSSEVVLKIRHGPEARDYSKLAKKKHLSPLFESFEIIQDAMHAFQKQIIGIRSKQAKAKSRNKSILPHALYATLTNICILTVAFVAQVVCFRSFLRKRKVI